MAMRPLKVEIKTNPHVLGHGKVRKAIVEITSNDGKLFDFDIEGTFVGDNGLGDVDWLQIFAQVKHHGWTRVHIFRDGNSASGDLDEKSQASSGGIALLRARRPSEVTTGSDEMVTVEPKRSGTATLINPASEPELLQKFNSGLLQLQANLKPNLGKDALKLKEIDFGEYSVGDLVRFAFSDSNKAWYPVFLFGLNPTIRDLAQVKGWAEKNRGHYFAEGVLKK